jgi:hypothetical protein
MMKNTNIILVVIGLIAVLTTTASAEGYAQTILADNPVGYWQLGEESGNQAVDASGNGFHGTYTGGVTLGQTGAVENPTPDTAALFDGTSGYIDMGVEPSLYSLPSEFTVEAWVKPSQDAPLGMILSTRRFGSGAGGYGLSVSSGELRFTSFTLRDYRCSYSFPADEWTHVAAVFHSTATTSLYVNGQWQKDVGGEWHYIVVAEPFNIGRNPNIAYDSYLPFDGGLDEVAVYPYALTDNQLETHYLAAVPEPPILLEGDANRDGVVSAADYAAIQGFFGQVGDPGMPGDANGDGVVSAGDYASVQANFGNTAPTQVTPEPATMSLLAIGGLALIRRNRK